MRLVVVIVSLAAIAVGLVQIRRAELNVRCEMQRLKLQEVALQRQIGDQEVRRGELLAVDAVRQRAVDLAINLVRPTPGKGLASGMIIERPWKK